MTAPTHILIPLCGKTDPEIKLANAFQIQFLPTSFPTLTRSVSIHVTQWNQTGDVCSVCQLPVRPQHLTMMHNSLLSQLRISLMFTFLSVALGCNCLLNQELKLCLGYSLVKFASLSVGKHFVPSCKCKLCFY
jgi:hypothetical protein